MHRRQYLPGSRDGVKLNRERLYAKNKELKDIVAHQDSLIAERNQQLQAWEREVIKRGWRALVAAAKRFLTKPLRLQRGEARPS